MSKKNNIIVPLLSAAMVAIMPFTALGSSINAQVNDPQTLGAVSVNDEQYTYWHSMSTTYYYEQIETDEEAMLYDALDNMCMQALLSDNDIPAGTLKINIAADPYWLTADEASNVFWLFYWSNPQYFFLQDTVAITNGYLTLSMFPDFTSGAKRKAGREKIVQSVDSYMACAQQYSRTEEKERAIHTMMCETIEDDFAGWGEYLTSIHSAAVGVTRQVGYAMFFEALMNKCGINCICVSDIENTWNMIELYGNWYVVSVANNDQTDYGFGIQYKYYNTNEQPSNKRIQSYLIGLLPESKYDVVESDVECPELYFTVDGITYFIANGVYGDYGYIAKAVSGMGSNVPDMVMWAGRTYAVEHDHDPYVPKTGWFKENDVWVYYDENERRVTGWERISGKWYYFDEDGAMVTGWMEVDGKWYYFNAAGAMSKGWVKISNKWYYFDDGGAMVNGWKKISGKYYYFNSNGVMQTGWIQDAGKWYFLNSNGAMQKGWMQSGRAYYYFDGTGAMVTGWKKISGVYYYFSSTGKMMTGWIQDADKWYYLDSNGAMHTGWFEENNHTYYMEASGAMAADKTITIDGQEYIFNSSGYCMNPPSLEVIG